MSALLQFSQFVQKTFALWVVLFSGIALMIPEAFVWLRAYIPWMLGIIMFGMGMTMTVGDFKSVLQSPKAVAIGVVAQFMVMPGLAFLLCKLFQLPPEIAIGVISGGLLSGRNCIQCDYLYGQGQYCLVGRLYLGFYVTGAHSNSGHFLLVGQSVD